MRTRPGAAALTGVALLLLLTACAAGPNTAAGGAPATDAGFLLGLWHGLIAPVTFVVSLFTESVGIYEIHNVGGWYDFGFLLGASGSLGGGAGAGAVLESLTCSPAAASGSTAPMSALAGGGSSHIVVEPGTPAPSLH